MICYILLDLNLPAWERNGEDPLNNICVFINAILLSKYGNVVKVINNMTVIYDSTVNLDFATCLKASSCTSRLSANDLGFALMDCPDQVLIFEMSNEEQSEYLNYLKCMFVAQSRGIKINGFSHRSNMLVKMCVQGSGGRFMENCGLKNMLQLLALPEPDKDSYEISCTCCNKHINLAMVCAICLSVYCKFIPVCRRCKTKFSFIK